MKRKRENLGPIKDDHAIGVYCGYLSGLSTLEIALEFCWPMSRVRRANKRAKDLLEAGAFRVVEKGGRQLIEWDVYI